MKSVGYILLAISVALPYALTDDNDDIYTIYDVQDRQPRRDCSYRAIPHGIMEPDSSTYTSGTTVRYSCAIGYALVGAGAATCEDGRWDRRVPICDVQFTPTTTPSTIVCSYYAPDDGKAIPQQRSYEPGISVAYVCNTGYKLVGTSINICLKDGTWVLKAPKCDPVKKTPKPCKKRLLANGEVIPDKTMYKSKDVVLYSCVEGYVLKGDAASACFEGEWTSSLPECEEKLQKRCTRPPFANGKVFPSKTMYENLEVIQYDCERGYNLKGQRTAACFEGKWTSRFPRCEDSGRFTETEIYCPPPSVDNASYSPKQNQYAVGSVVTVVCGDDYFLTGSGPSTCQENGQWGNLPTCVSGCQEPIIQNGYYNTRSVKTGPFFPSGSLVIVFCNNQYVIEGAAVLRCRANNQWDSKMPTCKKITITITESGCSPPSYSFVTYSPMLPEGREVYSVGDTVTYICKGEWHALGHNTAECLPSGKWSKKPTCATKCRRPKVMNGRVNKKDEFFTQNKIIRIICDEGYLVVGKKTARCQYDGTWSQKLRCTDGCYQPKVTGLQIYPAPLEGGNVYEFGKRVNFRCNAGFSVSVASAKCRGQNKWDKTIPRCKLISNTNIAARSGCARPTLTEGLILKNEFLAVYPYKTQFEFQCERGFNMIGSAVSICRKHLRGPLGGLDPSPPRCERVKCGSPGQPQNGRFRDGSKGSFSFGDTVYYECNDKHIMSGVDHLTCQADGQFNGVPPLCQPPSCRVECKLVAGRECQCDALCRVRGDCCYDFEQHCRRLFY